jgi:hypothetical protein
MKNRGFYSPHCRTQVLLDDAKASLGVVLLSKGDFSPFMMRLLPCESHPNAGNSIREGASAIYSARLGRPRSLIMEAQKPVLTFDHEQSASQFGRV